jgi:hypothetical protein
MQNESRHPNLVSFFSLQKMHFHNSSKTFACMRFPCNYLLIHFFFHFHSRPKPASQPTHFHVHVHLFRRRRPNSASVVNSCLIFIPFHPQPFHFVHDAFLPHLLSASSPAGEEEDGHDGHGLALTVEEGWIGCFSFSFLFFFVSAPMPPLMALNGC